jgi:hypothetical protein
MANYKITALEQIQYLASAMFSKWKATVDSTMSSSSTNPVQNKVVKTYVEDTFKSTLKDVEFTIDPDTGILYYKKTMNS